MDVVVDRVAGLDIGKATVTVCVRTPGPGATRASETRTYSTMTRPLQEMAAWLVESGVTLAAMESRRPAVRFNTGPYVVGDDAEPRGELIHLWVPELG